MKQADTSALRSAWVLYPLLLLATMAAWAWSSPPGSSPDEDFHLVTTWCALGPREGLCEPGSKATTKAVPWDVANVACFAFKPNESGSCPSHGKEIVQTMRWNDGGLYPDGFFVVMGALAGPSVEVSVLAMRLLNATIYAGGLAALLLLAPIGRRANYMLASLVTLVPMGLFIVPSVNPSSWAVTSATLVWPSAVEFARSSQRWKRLALGILCLFGFALAFASRSDAAAYAGLAVGLAWLAAARFDRRTLIYGGLVGGAVVIALLWSLSLGSFQRLGVLPPFSFDEPDGGIFRRIKDLPNLYAGSFGTRGLGWLDTTMPWITWILAGSVFALAIFWGLRRCRWRKAVSLLTILTVGAVIPILLATARQETVLAVLQPRYFLPLIVMAAMVAVSEDNPNGPELNLAQCLVITGSLFMAHAGALHANLRRYLTGSEAQWFNLDAGVEWWWKVWAPSPMVVFGIGAIAFLGAAFVVSFTAIARADFLPAEEQAEPRRVVGSD